MKVCVLPNFTMFNIYKISKRFKKKCFKTKLEAKWLFGPPKTNFFKEKSIKSKILRLFTLKVTVVSTFEDFVQENVHRIFLMHQTPPLFYKNVFLCMFYKFDFSKVSDIQN